MKYSRTRRVTAVFLASFALVTTSTVTSLATLALFSDVTRSTGHVTAGNLELEFKRTRLSGLIPNASNGILEEVSDDTIIDLKTDTNDIFNIEHAVPGMSVTATLELTNVGTVAFNAVVSIINVRLGQDEIAEASAKLAQNLDIQIYTLDGSNNKVGPEFKLSEYNSVTSFGEYRLINKNDKQVFYVEARLDESVGNDVQKGQASFDVHVDASQILTN